MADIQTTTNPSISDLCHQWRVAQARVNLETLEAADDETLDAAVDRAVDECDRIIDTIAQTEAKNLGDVSSMLRIAKKLILDTSCGPLMNPDFQVVQLIEKAIASTADLKAGYKTGISEERSDAHQPNADGEAFNRAWSAYLDAEAAIQRHCAAGENISADAREHCQTTITPTAWLHVDLQGQQLIPQHPR